MKDKEIIGYRLKDSKDVKYLDDLFNLDLRENYEKYGYHFSDENIIPHVMKKSKIDPVYKEEPKLEVGKWHTDKKKKTLVFIIEVESELVLTYYGFDYQGKWFDKTTESVTRYGIDCLSPATEKEVEEALIAEAKRRGFKEGVKFKELDNENIRTFLDVDAILTNLISSETPLQEWDDIPSHCSNPLIFDSGKWAEIIEEKPTKEQLLKDLEQLKEKINLL